MKGVIGNKQMHDFKYDVCFPGGDGYNNRYTTFEKFFLILSNLGIIAVFVERRGAYVTKGKVIKVSELS